MRRGAGEPSLDERVETAVATYLQARAEGRPSSIDDLCGGDAELADEVRSSLAVIEELGLDPAVSDNVPLQQLGPYALERRLGGGGMGVVYLGRDPDGHEVAVKIVRPDLALFDGAHRRFRREIDTVRRLEHPGIVPLLDVGEEADVAFLVMPRIRGCTLAELLAQLAHRPPSALHADDWRLALRTVLEKHQIEADVTGWDLGSWWEICTEVARQVARALQHAHDQGVIHRDVKPSNIFVTPDGQALLFDFGLARDTGASPLTRTGATMGSLPYLAPEQVRGVLDADWRTDVYGLGVTLYQMLTLRLPYDGPNPEALRQRILEGSPMPMRQAAPSLPRDAETVTVTAMEPAAHRRYRTADEFAQELHRLKMGRPIHARPAGRLLQTARWARRRPVVVSALAVTAVLVMASFGYGLRQGQLAEREQLMNVRLAYTNRQAEQSLSRERYANLVSKQTIAAANAGLTADLHTRAGLSQLDGTFYDEGVPRIERLSNQAFFLAAIGEYDEAWLTLEEALELQCDQDVADPLTLAEFYLETGRVHRELRHLMLAEVSYENAFTNCDAGRGLLQADAEARLALDIQREWLGRESPEARRSLMLLVRLAIQRQNTLEARDLLEEARDLFHVKDPLADLALDLQICEANVEAALGHFQRAAQRMADVHERLALKHGRQHPTYLDVTFKLAYLMNRAGRFRTSDELWREGFGALEGTPEGEKRLKRWGFNWVRALDHLGDRDEADRRLTQLGNLAEGCEPGVSPRSLSFFCGHYWHVVAKRHQSRGERGPAAAAYDRAVLQYTRMRRPDDPRDNHYVAWVGINQTAQRRASGLPVDEAWLEECLRIVGERLESAEGRGLSGDPLSRIMRVRAWGEALLVADKPARAVEPLLRTVEGLEQIEGESRWYTARAQSLLGEAYRRLGNIEEARELLERAHDMLSKDLDAQHPLARECAGWLADLESDEGHPILADEWAARASPRLPHVLPGDLPR